MSIWWMFFFEPTRRINVLVFPQSARASAENAWPSAREFARSASAPRRALSSL